MKRKIGKRFLQFIPVLLGITFLTFALMYISPANPAGIRLSAQGVTPSPEAVEALQEKMGLNRPFLVQYFDWLWKLLRGDFGRSYADDVKVADKLLVALPYTLRLAFLSMGLTLLLSIPTGIYIAARKNKFADYIVRFLSFVGNAVPNFIIGVVLLYIVSYRLKWIGILEESKNIGMILPSLTLALVMSSRFIRQIRAATLDELGQEYIVAMRARGISDRVILYKNVLKNIMITVVTLSGISLGSLLGGTMVVETIFNWPGVGSVVMEAISARDYPVIQAFVVWVATIYMLVNLLTDISYTWFNPKIRDI
ncbi:MAG TPA: nickel ABC transporter permease [Lachnospiraceae bacterium]